MLTDEPCIHNLAWETINLFEPVGKCPPGRLRRRWKDNMKMDIREIDVRIEVAGTSLKLYLVVLNHRVLLELKLQIVLILVIFINIF
jgi:hypothetical protein